MPDMEADDRGQNDDYYLELSADPIRFESVSCLTNVFFDDSKQQVSCFQLIKNFLSLSDRMIKIYLYIGICCSLRRCYRSAR